MSKALFNDFIQAQNTVYPSVIKELTPAVNLTPAVKSVQSNLGDFNYAA